MAIILLSGPESFLKEEALGKLRQGALAGRNRELNYNIFYGGESHTDFSATLNTDDFFTENKLVVIKNVDRLSSSQKECLLSYIKKPSHHTCLVLETNHMNPEKNFLSILAKHAKVVRCNRLHGPKLYNWVHKQAHNYRKRISKEAVELLLELKGNDLRLLAMELDKLATYVGDRDHITAGDIADLVGRSLTQDIFGLIDAISQRDSQHSLSLVSLLMRDKRRETEIIGLLGWHFRRLWKAKQLEKDKTAESHIGRMLRIPNKYLSKFFGQLSHFDVEDIKKNLEILTEADRDLKTGRKKGKLILELVMVRLCSA